MFDALAIIGNLGVIIYLIFTLFTEGLDSFTINYIFIGYLVFTTFTIPFLISKTLFKARFVSISTAFSFLYFPLQFLFTYVLSRISGFSLGELLPFYTLFNIILWNFLFIFFILSDERSGDHSEKILRRLFFAMFPGILFSIFTFFFIRQPNSIVALDYLQHLVVPNRMLSSDMLCLLPGQCSNLFLQHGYTTFYHIVYGNMVSFLGTDPIKTIYIIDVLFPIIASIPLFYIFRDFTKSTIWSQIGVLFSLLVFVMGGYDFVFFIPQTFALFLFLMIYREKKLSKTKFVLSAILLVSTHFIIGTYLAGFLYIKHFILKHIDRKKEVKIFYLILLISVIFFTLANIAGFSFEKLVQAEDIDIIGSLTNPYYPNNLNVFWQILGPMWLFVIIIFITNLLERKISRIYLEAITYIAMITVVYFLAPTYANKFTIGIGFFSSLLIIKFLSTLKMGIFLKSFVFTALLVIFTSNFFVQYNRYLAFYTQQNGTVSAITQEDMAVVEYLKTQNNSSVILSDPYTQLIVESLTNSETANAQYMSLQTREKLLEYLNNPNMETYEDLIISPGLPRNNNFSILYTSRIERAIKNEDNSWIYNIYSLSINNSEKIESIDKELLEEMERTGRYPVYISDNFVLFK
jgi:hypothetical protein